MFTENQATRFGGAVATLGDVKLSMRLDVFKLNIAPSGGAAYFGASLSDAATGIDASRLPFIGITATANMAGMGCKMKTGYNVKNADAGKGVILSNGECVDLCRTLTLPSNYPQPQTFCSMRYRNEPLILRPLALTLYN